MASQFFIKPINKCKQIFHNNVSSPQFYHQFYHVFLITQRSKNGSNISLNQPTDIRRPLPTEVGTERTLANQTGPLRLLHHPPSEVSVYPLPQPPRDSYSKHQIQHLRQRSHSLTCEAHGFGPFAQMRKPELNEMAEPELKPVPPESKSVSTRALHCTMKVKPFQRRPMCHPTCQLLCILESVGKMLHSPGSVSAFLFICQMSTIFGPFITFYN